MEGQTELQGWELLPRVDPLRPSSASAASDEDGGDPFGVITADYFVLDSGDKSGVLEDEKCLSEVADLVSAEPDQTLTVESSPDSTIEAVVSVGNTMEEEMDLGGEVCSEDGSDVSWLDSWGDEIGGVREFEQIQEEPYPKALGRAEGSPRACSDSFGLVDVGEKKDDGWWKAPDVWWKVPLELVKFCVSRVKPAWSISIAAVVLGLVVLSRRLYRMRRPSRRISIAAGLDDKKARRFPATAHLKEAFTALRHAPSIKAPLPTAGVTPWPTMALRL